MTKRQRPPSSSSRRTNLASCVVATLFLVFVVIVILIVFFTVFKPKDPKISVNAVQLPSFSISNNTVNFTFSQYVSVKNPNRAAFSHYDSTLQLLYSGSQVGFMFIPAGEIASGHTQYMAATFAVQSFPLSSSPDSASSVVVGGPPVFPNDQVTGGLVNNGGNNGNYNYNYNNGGGGGGQNNYYNRVGPTMEIQSRIQMGGRVRVLHFFTHHVEARTGCRVAISVNDGSVLGFHC